MYLSNGTFYEANRMHPYYEFSLAASTQKYTSDYLTASNNTQNMSANSLVQTANIKFIEGGTYLILLKISVVMSPSSSFIVGFSKSSSISNFDAVNETTFTASKMYTPAIIYHFEMYHAANNETLYLHVKPSFQVTDLNRSFQIIKVS